jgi:hypothetical protein
MLPKILGVKKEGCEKEVGGGLFLEGDAFRNTGYFSSPDA